MSEFTTASKEGGIELWRIDRTRKELSQIVTIGPVSMRQFKWDETGLRVAVWNDETLYVFQIAEDQQTNRLLELTLTKRVEAVTFSRGPWVAVKLDCNSDNLCLGNTDSKNWSKFSVRERQGDESGLPFHFHGLNLFCYLSTDSSLRLVDLTSSFDKEISKSAYQIAQNVTDFAVGPMRPNPQSLVIAVFRRALDASPGTISIIYVDAQAQSHDFVVKDALLERATEVEMKWNKIGSVILIKESAAVDLSGTSYYGSSQLYALRTAKNATVKTIVSRSGGPVQFYGWSSVEREIFYVGYGKLPCKIEMWSAAKTAPKLDLGLERRNYLSVSRPTNTIQATTAGSSATETTPNLVLIGGFGNLPGDVEVWDMTAQKIVGQAKLPWTVEIEFSPNNLLLLASTTTPRLRVDNCIKVVGYNGEPITTRDFQELYQASWRPRCDVSCDGYDPRVGIYKQTSSKAVDTGLVLRKKGGGFGNALSAALSRTTPVNAGAEPRKAVRSADKKSQVAQIPGMPAFEPSIPGAPQSQQETRPKSKH